MHLVGDNKTRDLPSETNAVTMSAEEKITYLVKIFIPPDRRSSVNAASPFRRRLDLLNVGSVVLFSNLKFKDDI